MKKLVLAASLALTVASLTGCNLGAIALAEYSQPSLEQTTVTGTLANAPSTVKVGYVTWVELEHNAQVSSASKLNFDLVQQNSVTFDKVVTPSNGTFSLTINPSQGVQDGTYVVFAWDDQNGNGVYDGDQGEKRAPEVYRVEGVSGTNATWKTEKYIFTSQQLSVQYADQNGGVSFSF